MAKFDFHIATLNPKPTCFEIEIQLNKLTFNDFKKIQAHLQNMILTCKKILKFIDYDQSYKPSKLKLSEKK